MTQRPHNFNRQRIIDNNYLSLIDNIPLSQRNKNIITSYTQGKSYEELSKEHNITSQRVGAIVQDYVRKCINYEKRHGE